MGRSINNKKYTKTPVGTLIYIVFIITLFIVNFSCSKTDDGDEHCPIGYTGSNCDVQITPDSVIITKIEVIRFPALNAQFQSWDSAGNPDIYVQILQNDELLWTSSNVHQNAKAGNVYRFIPSDTLALNDPLGQYAIYLFDEDDDGESEIMGGINFISYSSDNGFPELMILDDGGEVAFGLSLEYWWKQP